MSLTKVRLPPREFVLSAEASGRSYNVFEAQEYTRWLATHHYENFQVVSLILPRRLHQDFFNLYSFCRWADDLGDEFDDRCESERLLAWWASELENMYRGEVTHPVFMALQRTVARYRLPIEPFLDLIRAFQQDQRVNRYRTFEELFAYCRWSANPVGRLVLCLFGCSDDQRIRLSDATCTALQLANFWQDVAVDLNKNRLYLPLELLERHGCSEKDVLERRATPEFRSAMREAVEIARGLFRKGLPLAGSVNRRLAVDVALFSRGGMRTLDKIERQGYDVFSQRPSLSRGERAWLFVTTLARTVLLGMA